MPPEITTSARERRLPPDNLRPAPCPMIYSERPLALLTITPKTLCLHDDSARFRAAIPTNREPDGIRVGKQPFRSMPSRQKHELACAWPCLRLHIDFTRTCPGETAATVAPKLPQGTSSLRSFPRHSNQGRPMTPTLYRRRQHGLQLEGPPLPRLPEIPFSYRAPSTSVYSPHHHPSNTTPPARIDTHAHTHPAHVPRVVRSVRSN
jgi:hypothetical protein